MGAGKTTAGKALAEQSGLQFYDLDTEITKRYQKSIRQIITESGEDYFRELEYATLQTLNDPGIYATGGGTLTTLKNLELIINTADLIIWLKPGWKILWERIKSSDRPLLVGKYEEDIKQLYLDRIAHYQQCSTLIYAKNQYNSLGEMIFLQ